ncbi:MAG: hypothetical protein ACREU7_09585 [Burkholderiales bacterium]
MDDRKAEVIPLSIIASEKDAADDKELVDFSEYVLVLTPEPLWQQWKKAPVPHDGNAIRTAHIQYRQSGIWWDFFREPDGQWRWQRIDCDGNLVALSPASHPSLDDCVTSAEADGFMLDETTSLADR